MWTRREADETWCRWCLCAPRRLGMRESLLSFIVLVFTHGDHGSRSNRRDRDRSTRKKSYCVRGIEGSKRRIRLSKDRSISKTMSVGDFESHPSVTSNQHHHRRVDLRLLDQRGGRHDRVFARAVPSFVSRGGPGLSRPSIAPNFVRRAHLLSAKMLPVGSATVHV